MMIKQKLMVLINLCENLKKNNYVEKGFDAFEAGNFEELFQMSTEVNLEPSSSRFSIKR